MLNELFKNRMKALLSCEYGAFISEIEENDAVSGVRLNKIKAPSIDGDTYSELGLIPLPYAEDGYILSKREGIGLSPYHHAGVFYVQDPGAMATVSALDIREDFKICDTCSAPGGKSGQAGAKINEHGFLLSNEFVPKRAKTVVSNFERLGIRRAMVTSLDTGELPKMFSAFFDLVIADVPCSGEGMFRKNEAAISGWSEENVISSAKRQEYIINNAAPLVKAGGYLLYSTCTYSLEENEMIIDAFLDTHKDFELTDVREELQEVTSPGIAFSGIKCRGIEKCRRFYPHVSRGEGQFIALMRRSHDAPPPKILYKDSSERLTKEESLAVETFFKKNLMKAPEGKLIKVNGNIVISEHGIPIPKRSVFSSGVLVGEVSKGNLFPSHQFFSAYGKLFIRQENLTRCDERVEKYLRGEEIPAREAMDGGYSAVFYMGAPLGGGKVSSGVIKNHYPKGLRNK